VAWRLASLPPALVVTLDHVLETSAEGTPLVWHATLLPSAEMTYAAFVAALEGWGGAAVCELRVAGEAREGEGEGEGEGEAEGEGEGEDGAGGDGDGDGDGDIELGAGAAAAPAAAATSSSSTGAPSSGAAATAAAPVPAPAAPVPARDAKGRALAGRFEMSIYERADAAIVDELVANFGLAPAGEPGRAIPRELLYTRSESSKNIVVVSEPIARIVVPQQKMPSGDGRVKTVNAGVRLFSENKGGERHRKERAEATSAAAAAAGAGPGATALAARPSAGPPTIDFRLAQEGLAFVVPYMTRQVVFASCLEVAQVLRFRGQFVAADVYPPRLRRCFEAVDVGSFALVAHPALDGAEDLSAGVLPPRELTPPGFAWAGEALELAPALPSPFAAALTAAAAASSGAPAPAPAQMLLRPRTRVPLRFESAIAPALRAHYALEAGAAEPTLLLSPSLRVWQGAGGPLSRVAMCCWKGKNKYNLMVHTLEAAGLVQALCSAGYRAQ
jgi:hypothetical protein